jgi:hypothetical protein
MIIPPLMGLLMLALTTVYGFVVNTFALWVSARLLALEKRGVKTAMLTAFTYTVICALMFSVSYLAGLFSDLFSIILVYASIVASTILLMLLIKMFYKLNWKTAATSWLLLLGINVVINVLLSIALMLLTTLGKIIL